MTLKKFSALVAVLALGLALTACQSTDVVGKFAVTSFEALLNTTPDKITNDVINNYWIYTSPAGDELMLSKDFSSSNPDAVVEFDAAPFIAAGLTPESLPVDQYKYDPSTNRIVMPYEIGDTKLTYTSNSVAIETFEQIVKNHRDIIGYHEVLDHYGIALGNGNLFEWAKDLAKNDKDIVFVLNPQPFIEAGLDTAKLEGWVFAQVEVKDEKGKPVLVDKILRPFNLD